MNPLTLVLAMLVATTVTGPFLIAAFTLGLYGWPSVLMALALGLLGAGVLAARIEAETKRQDPDWDEHRDRPRLVLVRSRGDEAPVRFDPRRHWRH
jgi:hypothetical protein